MEFITKEEAIKTVNTLMESAIKKSEERFVKNVMKTVYVFNNCDFEIFTEDNKIIRIDIYKYNLNGGLYDTVTRFVK